MKIYAYYLPQYHEIPENDEWWGKGFTEWRNVKAAIPLYKGHHQPRIPYHENYYNLLDKNTVEWQTSLMKKYHVDGLVYYHYYFRGKLLLEKPAENLLKWKDIDQKFFFCWANHPWIRSWEGKKETIMPLDYGNEEDWEKHFRYLLQFFKDIRYEKKDNKPLFCIFKSEFTEKNRMFTYFNKRCKEEGFDGIYLIETFSGEISLDSFLQNLWPETNKVVFREPAIQTFAWKNYNHSYYARGKRKLLNILRNHNIYRKPAIYDGNKLMKQKINCYKKNELEIPCVWFEWDNTPRHKQRGYVITPYDKGLFRIFMDCISEKEYLFINAWNEWAEGMMLEPTKKDGCKYLEWIREWRNGNENRSVGI
ncbi:MAG: polysaccharide biosynthesis protein [Dorea sp.]|nr:polysaccharide biosynthesis protein [Dorea sp.]